MNGVAVLDGMGSTKVIHSDGRGHSHQQHLWSSTQHPQFHRIGCRMFMTEGRRTTLLSRSALLLALMYLSVASTLVTAVTAAGPAGPAADPVSGGDALQQTSRTSSSLLGTSTTSTTHQHHGAHPSEHHHSIIEPHTDSVQYKTASDLKLDQHSAHQHSEADTPVTRVIASHLSQRHMLEASESPAGTTSSSTAAGEYAASGNVSNLNATVIPPSAAASSNATQLSGLASTNGTSGVTSSTSGTNGGAAPAARVTERVDERLAALRWCSQEDSRRLLGSAQMIRAAVDCGE